jgi:hypothetical protein
VSSTARTFGRRMIIFDSAIVFPGRVVQGEVVLDTVVALSRQAP